MLIRLDVLPDEAGLEGSPGPGCQKEAGAGGGGGGGEGELLLHEFHASGL